MQQQTQQQVTQQQQQQQQLHVQQSQLEQQPEQMTEQLSKQLLGLLLDPNPSVKHATLNAILQYTKNESSKLLFLNTDFFKLVVDNRVRAQLQKICLSTLIHFSSSQQCAEKIVEYIQPVLRDIKKWDGLIEELGLLLVLNISKQEKFVENILPKSELDQLELSQQQKAEKDKNATENNCKQNLINVLLTFGEEKPARRWIIANIFVNISSHEKGREYIATNRIYLNFIKYINDDKQSLRIASLKILRNVVFMWENEDIVVQLLKQENHVIDQVAIHILVMIIKSELVEKLDKALQLLKDQGYSGVLDYGKLLQPQIPKIKTTKETSISELQISIDIIIILSNADFPTRKPQFLKDQLKKVIGLLNFTSISQESKDKLEALETFCFW